MLQWLLLVVAVYEQGGGAGQHQVAVGPGTGLFGMVYEGTARNIKDKADIVKVTIKASNSPPNTSLCFMLPRRSCLVGICDKTVHRNSFCGISDIAIILHVIEDIGVSFCVIKDHYTIL